MKAPAFWHRPAGLTAFALAPAGALYGLATAARMRFGRGVDAGLPVICVGNFTLGGTGKTPAVQALAERLRAAGERPFVLSRGYGGTRRGPHLVDAARDTAADVGDEPMLHAATVPVVVGRDRPAGASLASERGATVLLMDDGLQNPSLRKDLAVAVVDGGAGLGNGLPFPAGPLRAPLALQLPAVGAVLVVGRGERGEEVGREAQRRGVPVLTGHLAPTSGIAALRGRPVLAFCGIGRPERFRASLREAGIDVRRFRAFGDHQVLSRRDVEGLLEQAAGESLDLVTTRKDFMRLLGHSETVGVAGLVNVVDVTLELDDWRALDRLVAGAISGRGARDSA